MILASSRRIVDFELPPLLRLADVHGLRHNEIAHSCGWRINSCAFCPCFWPYFRPGGTIEVMRPHAAKLRRSVDDTHPHRFAGCRRAQLG
jgi:hypothetical protein